LVLRSYLLIPVLQILLTGITKCLDLNQANFQIRKLFFVSNTSSNDRNISEKWFYCKYSL